MESLERKIDLLRTIGPFAQLPTVPLRPVAQAAEVASFAAGEVIVRQGDPGDAVFALIEGTAEVWIGEDRRTVGPGVSAFMPAGVRHGFRNVGQDVLRIRGAFAARELVTHFVGHEEHIVRADLPIPWEPR